MKGTSTRLAVCALTCLAVMGSSASAVVIQKGVAELTRQADQIVIGDVVEVTSFWTADNSMIRTRVVVRVDDYLKDVTGAGDRRPTTLEGQPGTVLAERIAHLETLELDGGTVDDTTLVVSVLPRFDLGDRVLLFLDNHETRLVGGYQGAYLTDGNLAVKIRPGCARSHSDGYMPLGDLLREIAAALDPQHAGNASIEAVTPYQGDFSLPLAGPRYVLCGYDWTYNANPMGESYVINANCSDGGAGSSSQQIAELNKGADAWTNAGADFAFNYGGTSNATSVTYNGVNLVFFSNNPPGGGGYVAATYIWQSGGSITECDLVFNDRDYSWWNGQGGCNWEMDIWNVATHEFGHFLCLTHSSNTAATMYAYVDYCQTAARSLHSDDINGILAIYGAGGGPSCGDGNCDAGEDQCSCPSDCGNPPGSETSCTDGVDNDCDGNTDCADADCNGDPACGGGPSCGDGNCDAGEDQCSCPSDCGNPPGSETSCTDGVDNDCDGNTDCADADCNGDPACGGGPGGEGFILSRNADFSTDDRAFYDNETIYMLVWSDQVDHNDIRKAEWELRDANKNKVKQPLTNQFDGTYTASFSLGGLPSNATDWTWKGKIEDNNRTKYNPTTSITVQPGGGGAFCGDGNCDAGEDQCSCPNDCGNPPGSETSCTDGVDNDCDGNTDCADADCNGDPACGGGPGGEGFILSRNADFSTDDRSFTRGETLYMLMWTDQVDFNDISRARWELKDPNKNKVREPMTNNFDGTYSASFSLSGLPSNATDWTWKGEVKDNPGNRYKPTASITVSP